MYVHVHTYMYMYMYMYSILGTCDNVDQLAVSYYPMGVCDTI